MDPSAEESELSLPGPKKPEEISRSSFETPGRKRVEFVLLFGDITDIQGVEAIVCPSNSGFQFTGLGGVECAIEKKAGRVLFDEAERKAGAAIERGLGVPSHDGKSFCLPVGSAIVTHSGSMWKIKNIIHVNNMHDVSPAPAYCDEEAVRLSVMGALGAADDYQIKSVVFPALGSGGWGMSIEASLRATLHGMREYFQGINRTSKIEKVGFILYAQPSLDNTNRMKGILRDVLSQDGGGRPGLR